MEWSGCDFGGEIIWKRWWKKCRQEVYWWRFKGGFFSCDDVLVILGLEKECDVRGMGVWFIEFECGSWKRKRSGNDVGLQV